MFFLYLFIVLFRMLTYIMDWICLIVFSLELIVKVKMDLIGLEIYFFSIKIENEWKVFCGLEKIDL